jgi:CBS domain-containing protein
VVHLDSPKQLKARDLMVNIGSVTSEATVLDTIDSMLGKKSDGILVVDGGKLNGIVTDFDFIKCLKENKIPSVNVKISDIMTKEIIFAHPDDDFKHVVNLMFESSNRFIPIVSNKKPLGIITTKEIGKIFANHYGHMYKARDLMTYKYMTISVNDSLATFFRKIREYNDKYSVILLDEEVVGLVTPTNILEHLRQEKSIDQRTNIAEIMTRKPYTAKPDERCDKIANTMIDRNFTGVPIVDERLEGMIRYSCFLQFLEL